MSQGLPDVEYLLEAIPRCFSCKVDKDALLRPNREVVQLLYSRFLDSVHREWRDFDEGESNEILQLLLYLTLILGKYEEKFSFQDLVTPNRKRTLSILNRLVEFKEEIDHRNKKIKSRAATRHEIDDKIEKIRARIDEDKLDREGLYARIGASKLSADQQSDDIDDLVLRLKRVQQENDENQALQEKIKANLNTEKELNKIDEGELAEIRNRNLRLKSIKQTGSKIHQLRAERNRAERELETMKQKELIAKQDIELAIQANINSDKLIIQQKEKELAELGGELRQIGAREEKLAAKHHNHQEQVKSILEQSSQQLGRVQMLGDKAWKEHQTFLSSRAEAQKKIDLLVKGVTKEGCNKTLTNNETYTK